MLRDCAITVALKRAQVTMFREAEKIGLTHKVIHFDTNISLSSIGEYSRGETAMSGPAIIKMVGVIPDKLLSLLLPDGRQIVQAPSEINHDEIAPAMRDYLRAKDDAHHPESEAGRDIGEGEAKNLTTLAVICGGKVAA